MITDRSMANPRRFVVTALFGLGIGLFQAVAPGEALAQESGNSGAPARAAADAVQAGPGFEFTGYLGALTPLSTLAEQGDTLKAELSTSVSGGAGLDYWFSNGFGIGAFGSYARPDLTVFKSEGVGQFPDELKLGNVDYWVGVLTAMYRPNFSGNKAVLRPYFLLGGGIKYIESSEYTLEGGETLIVESSSKPVFTFGAGAHLILSRVLFLRLDVRDMVSKFDADPFENSKTQHDLFTSVGFGYSFH
ncbi:MAG: outer membrane beta-barrel protein [Gemmatimonadota bacterium]